MITAYLWHTAAPVRPRRKVEELRFFPLVPRFVLDRAPAGSSRLWRIGFHSLPGDRSAEMTPRIDLPFADCCVHSDTVGRQDSLPTPASFLISSWRYLGSKKTEGADTWVLTPLYLPGVPTVAVSPYDRRFLQHKDTTIATIRMLPTIPIGKTSSLLLKKDLTFPESLINGSLLRQAFLTHICFRFSWLWSLAARRAASNSRKTDHYNTVCKRTCCR